MAKGLGVTCLDQKNSLDEDKGLKNRRDLKWEVERNKEEIHLGIFARLYRCVGRNGFHLGWGFCLFVIRLAGIKPATESIPASHMGCWIGAVDPDYSTKMEKVDRNGYYSVFSLCVLL